METEADYLNFTQIAATSFEESYINGRNMTIIGYREISDLERYVEAAVLSVIALLGLSHNLLILVAGLSKRKLQRGINVLVVNMATVDFLANLVVYPLYACAILRGAYPGGRIGCKVELVFALQDVGVSVFTNFAIALNRCALTRSKQSCVHKLTKTKMTRAAVIAAWIFPILTCTGPIVLGLIELEYHFPYNACLPSPKHFDSLAFLIYNAFYQITIFGPLIGAIVCYIIVWRRVKSMTFNKRSDVSRRRYLKTTQNVAIIFLVFCICWVPDTVHWMIDPGYQVAPVWVTRAGVILYFTNSAINPFLFAWRFPAFRKTMVRMLSVRDHRRGSLISTYVTETFRRNTYATDKTASMQNAASRTAQTETEVGTSRGLPSNNNKEIVTCYVSSM